MAPKVIGLALALALILLFAGQSVLAVPLAPTPVAPRIAIDRMEVLFTWETPNPGATGFELEVVPANNDGAGVHRTFSCPEKCPTGFLFAFTAPAPPAWYGFLPDLGYTWRVRATDDGTSWSPWSDPATFRTPIRRSAGIQPLLANGAAVTGLTPSLAWSNSDADVFYYEVQLSKDPAFNTDPSTATASVYWNLVHGGVTTPKNSWSVPAASALEPSTTYSWRVRPRVQGDGTPVEWSTAWTFSTPAQQPSSPTATPTAGPSRAAPPAPTATPSPTATPTAAPSVGGLSIGPITFGLDLLDSGGCVLGRTGTVFPNTITTMIARHDYQGAGTVTTTFYSGSSAIGTVTDTLPIGGRCNWVRSDGAYPTGEYRVEVTSAGQLLGSGTFRTTAPSAR